MLNVNFFKYSQTCLHLHALFIKVGTHIHTCMRISFELEFLSEVMHFDWDFVSGYSSFGR